MKLLVQVYYEIKAKDDAFEVIQILDAHYDFDDCFSNTVIGGLISQNSFSKSSIWISLLS
jgi:hypothetical protein